MEQDIRNLFKNTNQNTNQNTNIGLSDDIWFAICERQTRLNKRATLSYLSLSIFSFVGLVLAAKDFIVEFGRSGFSQYFLSIFSDARLVTTYWKELLLSLADSLPIFSIVLLLSFIFILFISIKHVARQFRSPWLAA